MVGHGSYDFNAALKSVGVGLRGCMTVCRGESVHVHDGVCVCDMSNV